MSFFERHSKNQDKSGQAKERFDIGKKHLESREYASAIEAFTSAISIDSNYEDAYFCRAKSYGLTQQYDKVISDCSVVTAINPERTGSYIMRGIAYSVKNINDKAIEDYSKAISLDANISLAFLKRGKVYTSSGQYDKAIDDFNRLITLSPDSSEGYQVRGEAYSLIGKFINAIEDFTKVVEITPDDAEALFSRGGAYACNGDNEKAVPDLIKACNMGHEAACEMLNKIENSDKANKNVISLNEVEPDNIHTVDNHQTDMLMKQPKELQIGAATHLISSYLNYFINRGKEGDETQYAGAVYNMLNEASDYLVELGVTRNDYLLIDHSKIISTLNHFLYVLDDPINNWNSVLERNDISAEEAVGKISIELASEATSQFIEYWLGKNEAAQYAGAVNTMLCETCDWFIKQGRNENDSRFINYAIMLTTISALLYGKGEQDPQDQWNVLLEKHGLLPDSPVLSKE